MPDKILTATATMPTTTKLGAEHLDGGPIELLAEDEERGTFAGLAIAFDSPVQTWVPTIVKRGAFRDTLRRRGNRVKILREHNPELLIGTPIALKETAEGLYIRARITEETEAGREALALMRMSPPALDRMSIGFDVNEFKEVKKSQIPWTDGKPLNSTLRVITSIELF
ncbi:MAG: HK97 family phage prohead protease, partial [Acidobacteriota bacterium]|nr:HK97 family phage prohead protease [Acidobacteriota bacterium]